MNIRPYEIKIMKLCPYCQWRILDKVTPTTGIIEMKCLNCRRVVRVDLSYRTDRGSYSPKLA